MHRYFKYANQRKNIGHCNATNWPARMMRSHDRTSLKFSFYPLRAASVLAS
jgi:hypothetical protein